MPPKSVEVLTRKPKIFAVIEGPQRAGAASGEKKTAARTAGPGTEAKRPDLAGAARQQAETVLGIALQSAENVAGKAKEPNKNGSGSSAAENVLATLGSDNLLHRPVKSGVSRGIENQRMSITDTGDGNMAKVDD